MNRVNTGIESTDVDLSEVTREIRRLARTSDATHTSAHPDKGFQAFYRACDNMLESDQLMQSIFSEVLTTRAHSSAVHLVTLLPRAAQYILRRDGVTDYPTYSTEKWQSDILPKIIRDTRYIHLLKTKNNSTTRPHLRYKCLAAIGAAIERPVNVLDFGCSLNLGLAGVLNGDYLYDPSSREQLNDNTEGQFITKMLIKDNVQFNSAYGIDIVESNDTSFYEWVLACEYFSEYEATKQRMEDDFKRLSSERQRIKSITADIASNIFVDLIRDELGELENHVTVIYMAMTMYLLPAKDREQVLQNVEKLLKDGDIFLVMDYSNQDERFSQGNIFSQIYVKKDDQLSGPYEWLQWDSALCNTVHPGVDYSTVHKLLHLG